MSELKFSDEYITECATKIKDNCDLLQNGEGGINSYIRTMANIAQNAVIKGDEHEALLMFISNACLLQRTIEATGATAGVSKVISEASVQPNDSAEGMLGEAGENIKTYLEDFITNVDYADEFLF
ncbi:MAG: hypothetical protein K6B41_06300 [Butyrivibrio sp.]|nr:hypothetical protein [Butyrivibrio sp.]